MASFVHGSQRRAGWGGEIAATVQMPPLLASPPLSPIVTVTEPECFFVWVCVQTCVLYESVCVYLLESRGESRRDLADKRVALGREGIRFYPFLFFQLLGSCEFIFIQSL